MNDRETLLTREGLKKLEEELDYLKSVKRKEVAERIRQALDFGDISENAEYDEAKNEQAFVEGRILTIEKQLRNAQLIDSDSVTTDKVCLGSRVIIKDLQEGDKLEYRIVGSMEADPSEKRISNESPVGKAILGREKGSVVEVDAPEGTFEYEILDISR